jgi:plastocyanin
MTGSKTNSITVEATAARNGYQYRCVVKDANGSKVTTNAAKLTVNKSIEITTQPASATVAKGTKVTFKVEAKGSNLTYQWQFKSAGSDFWSDSSMAGSKTNSITVEATTARNGYQYRCVVKDANGSKVTTNAAKLTVQ